MQITPPRLHLERWPNRVGVPDGGGLVILLTGVSGAGKTTVGQSLASQLGWEFVDGDDYHPAANVEKMRTGIPLTDVDRAIRSFPSGNRRSGCRDFRIGLHNQIVAANHPALLRFLQRGTGGQGTQNVEQGCIGRNLQIEIEKAVDEDAHTPEQRSR